MALLPRAALGRAKEKRHNWPQPLRSLQVVWPDREGWVPGHLPRWPQETKPCNRWSKDAGVRTSLLDTMLLFFTSFLKFLLILPLLKCLFFSPLFHCYIKYVLLIFFYKILELLSSFLFKVTPLWSFSLRSQERALLFCVQSPCASLHYWLSAPGGRVQEGGGRSVSPANLYLTDTAFRPPPPSVWPTAPGSKKPPDNWELSNSFPGTTQGSSCISSSFSEHQDTWVVMLPAPRTSEIGAGVLSSHLHWPSCSRDEKNKLGIAPLGIRFPHWLQPGCLFITSSALALNGLFPALGQ